MYNQLTEDQRYTIYEKKQYKWSNNRIAKSIGVHRSTIGRELKRNRSKRGYRPNHAQTSALERRKVSRKPIKLTPEIKQIISMYIQKKWSPEQISGRLKLTGELDISRETIYKYLAANKREGGKLYTYLRRGGKKYRKRRVHSGTYLKDRKSIEERPSIVDEKSRIGDWEIDLIVGPKNQGSVLITMVERVSQFILIAKSETKSAKEVSNKICKHLFRYKDKVVTITSDNGVEFALHKKISEHLDADYYFCHPYSSWERGLNENSNSLIRQTHPKKKSLNNTNVRGINRLESYLNNRPRKTLGYKTPKEVFNMGVALEN